MYTFDSKIRYSETDSEGFLTLESLIDYFQDCSTFQTQDGPATIEYLKEKGMAWVITYWQIEISRFPKLCENVTIGTIPYLLKGPMGLRNFFMDTKDGERVAVANSVWSLFDFNRGLPCRVTPEIIEAYPIGPKLEMVYRSRKIVIPESGESFTGEDIQVRKHHLDTNNHVNNGQYVRMALDAVPDPSIRVKSLRVEYKKQALLGDVLTPVIIKEINSDECVYTIALRNTEGADVCVVQFIAFT